MKTAKTQTLDTIWRVPDALWERMNKVLTVYDPPAKVGRPRIDQRQALDALIYRLRTGCQWNYLPQEFGWGMSVYRTFRRWEQKGIFDILWALLLLECEELGGVDWQWQAADGCLGKARGVPRVQDKMTQQDRMTQKGAWTMQRSAMPQSVSAAILPTVPRLGSRRACLSRETAARLRSVLQEPTLPT